MFLGSSPFISRSVRYAGSERYGNGMNGEWAKGERGLSAAHDSLCYAQPSLDSSHRLLPLSFVSLVSFHSREERRRSVTRGMGWEKEGAMSGWEKEPAHITLHAGSCHPLTPRSFHSFSHSVLSTFTPRYERSEWGARDVRSEWRHERRE